jgi:hypothetical protein
MNDFQLVDDDMSRRSSRQLVDHKPRIFGYIHVLTFVYSRTFWFVAVCLLYVALKTGASLDASSLRVTVTFVFRLHDESQCFEQCFNNRLLHRTKIIAN